MSDAEAVLLDHPRQDLPLRVLAALTDAGVLR